MISKKAAKKLNDTAIELNLSEADVLDLAIEVYKKGKRRSRSKYGSIGHVEEAIRLLNEYDMALSELRRATLRLIKARKEHDLARSPK